MLSYIYWLLYIVCIYFILGCCKQFCQQFF